MKIKIGHDHIDDHHEELLALDTQLDKAISTNSRKGILPIIEFLEHYVVDHFHEEETLMQTKDYSGYDLHKQEHSMFKHSITGIRALYDSNTTDAHIIVKIRKCVDQLVRHIHTVDIGLQFIEKEN